MNFSFINKNTFCIVNNTFINIYFYIFVCVYIVCIERNLKIAKGLVHV